HAMGANWGQVNADGTLSINWNTPEYLAALKWLVGMTAYSPADALAADAMEPGYLTDKNTVAIIPEAESDYFMPGFLATPAIQQRYRTVGNVVGKDGKGGLYAGNPITMATSCPNKAAAWAALKWLSGSPEAQTYNFQNGWLPQRADGAKTTTQLSTVQDVDAILGQIGYAEARYPWATAKPRFALQSAIELALAKTIT